MGISIDQPRASCPHPGVDLLVPNMAQDQTSRAAILVVEGDRAIRELVRDCLADDGYDVVEASSPSAAIGLLARSTFALVIADPFTGSTVDERIRWAGLERIRAAAATPPIIIFSAHRRSEFADYARRGFAAVIEKPFDLGELYAMIHTIIR